MPRLQTIAPGKATGELKETYQQIAKLNGRVANTFQGMASSSAVLNAYFSLLNTLDKGELDPTDRELVYLAVSENNGCNYCVAVHTMIATKQIGLSEQDTLAARRFLSADKKRAALLEFVRRVIATKGLVSVDELSEFKEAGYTDGQITEVLAYVGLATFTNLFNNVHSTPLDFPSVTKL